MEDISRQDITQICNRLRQLGETEDYKLARILEDADVIPKLYQRAYVESLYQRTKAVKTPHQFEQKVEMSGDSYLAYLIWHNDALGAIDHILYKAHERQDEICDFADSTLPSSIIGRCQYDNHNENHEPELTEEEQEIWDKISEEEGWDEACKYFEDKINPANQKLTLVLNYNEDETKVSKDDGEYVCESCMEEINDMADGYPTCDLEFAE
jgi:hypothetical protein